MAGSAQLPFISYEGASFLHLIHKYTTTDTCLHTFNNGDISGNLTMQKSVLSQLYIPRQNRLRLVLLALSYKRSHCSGTVAKRLIILGHLQ